MFFNKKSPVSLQDIFFFLFLVALSAIFYQMLKPFLIDLFLTVVLAILFNRVYRFFKGRKKVSNSLAAVITILIVVFTIVIPLTFVGAMVSKEVAHNYYLIRTEWPKIEKQIEGGDFTKLLDGQPKLQKLVERMDMDKVEDQLEGFVTNVTRTVFTVAQGTFVNIANIVFHALMIVFFLYFFLVEGQLLQDRLQFLIPFDDKNEREFMTKMKDVTEGIIFNTFLVGAIEGTWGGVLLAIVGIPSPFFWGTLMVLLSIIPLVGANSILFPMTLFLFITGNVWQGVLVLVLGCGLITVNQNFIKPRLDGKRSGMHPAIVVIASLGGMFWMGLIGFLAGPFLAAGFLVIWDQFGKKYESQLKALNSGKEE